MDGKSFSEQETAQEMNRCRDLPVTKLPRVPRTTTAVIVVVVVTDLLYQVPVRSLGAVLVHSTNTQSVAGGRQTGVGKIAVIDGRTILSSLLVVY
jgi:hypothetical protein